MFVGPFAAVTVHEEIRAELISFMVAGGRRLVCQIVAVYADLDGYAVIAGNAQGRENRIARHLCMDIASV